LNTSTKIFNIVNETKKKVTPLFKKAFLDERWDTQEKLENYGKSVLEFILNRYGIAHQENIEHDSIFTFAKEDKIDWKSINPQTGNASIGTHTYEFDSTHYGFIEIFGDPFTIGDILSFNLVELVEKEHVFKNKMYECEKYLLYRPTPAAK